MTLPPAVEVAFLGGVAEEENREQRREREGIFILFQSCRFFMRAESSFLIACQASDSHLVTEPLGGGRDSKERRVRGSAIETRTWRVKDILSKEMKRKVSERMSGVLFLPPLDIQTPLS